MNRYQYHRQRWIATCQRLAEIWVIFKHAFGQLR